MRYLDPDIGTLTLKAADIQDLTLALVQGSIDNMPVGAGGRSTGSFLAVDATSLAVSGLITESAEAGITASTTHTIAGGTALTAQVNVIDTCANIGDAVTLAALAIGEYQDVYNEGAAAAGVYPAAVGVAIDGGTAGDPVTLTQAKRCRYTCVATNRILSEQLGVASA